MTAEPVSTAVSGAFSATLRESTREVHERAENSSFMSALLSGALPLEAYSLLAAQHYHIYGALEAVTDTMADDPVGSPFAMDGLRRVPALAEDLEYLAGPGWASALHPVPATQRYVERLRSVATGWPGGYVAHHYTRYLGDVSGGQVIRSVLKRLHGVVGPGARFYDFGDFASLGSPHAFRKHYRTLLDEAPWNAEEQERIVAEAVRAFELNIEVFEDLAAAVRGEQSAEPNGPFGST